jgi:hypothetical protein
MITQDQPAGAGRRVLLELGLRGASDNLVPETDPASGGTSTHPDSATDYLCATAQMYVSQGHMIAFRAWVLPSGATQRFDSPNYVSDGQAGLIHITSTWAVRGVTPGTGTYTTDSSHALPVSQATYGRIPAQDEAAFGSMVKVEGIIYPHAAFQDYDVVRDLGAGMTRTNVEIYASGGARIVDMVCYEHPWVLAIDDDDDGWVAHAYAVGDTPAQDFPFQVLGEGATTGDDRFGMTHALATAATMPRRLGPAIWSWCAGTDDDAATDVVSFGSGTGTDRMVPRAVTNTSFELLTRPGLTRTDDAPAASIRAGVYGRDYAQSGREHITPSTGSVRVHCAIYAKPASSSVTLTVRFHVEDWSYIDFVHLSTGSDVTAGWQWFQVTGWLECGANPAADKRLWCEAKVSSSQWDIGAITVHHMPEIRL